MTDSECDVTSSVGREVEEHANDGSIVPTFSHSRTIRIGTKRCSSGQIIGTTINQVSGFEDLGYQALLSKFNRSVLSCLQLNSQKFCKVTFFLQFKAQVAKLFDELINVCRVGGTNSSIVDVEDNEHARFVEEARIKFGLLEAKLLEPFDTGFVPKIGCHRKSIQAFLESEACART